MTNGEPMICTAKLIYIVQMRTPHKKRNVVFHHIRLGFEG
jgi:hypothetical protein